MKQRFKAPILHTTNIPQCFSVSKASKKLVTQMCKGKAALFTIRQRVGEISTTKSIGGWGKSLKCG
jgi:GH18 family chitinase